MNLNHLFRRRVDHLPRLALQPHQLTTLFSPDVFRKTLLEHIAAARRHIYLVALYLEDDEAGREVLEALRLAKLRSPSLQIKVLVDYHRAQRGLIGQPHHPGNVALYQAFAHEYPYTVAFYGVPVKSRELFGVLHLKGMVIDDCLLYSGASINNVYLQRQQRYRYDRYHLFEHPALATSFVRFIESELIDSEAVVRLDRPPIAPARQRRREIRLLGQRLALARYPLGVESEPAPDQLTVAPLVGLGRRRNQLNSTVKRLIRSARQQLVLYTPYFNLPRSLAREVQLALRRGVRIELVVGDKTANDFYIPPEQPFRTIGALPYLYELNLRRFLRRYRHALAAGSLTVRLWQDGDNSFHLKGMSVDERYYLLTGNNLNPRAWSLDLENGLLLHDPQGQLGQQLAKEHAQIRQHTRSIRHYTELDSVRDYPAPVKRVLRRVKRLRAEYLLKRLL